ncbi:MAG: putative bifunctional diguanylate cyclase/phosphodiesterase [Acidimicrobiales bacterium]
MRATAETPEELLRNADVAMYVAKAAGGGAVVFEEWMHERLTSRLTLESDLRHALQRDELEVHYLPVVDLHTQHVVGAEALVRWRHPERGLLAPDSFLAVAEETGLIVPLGRHVLEVAARQAQSWRAAGVTGTQFSIAVNVSARQLREPDLVTVMDGVLARSGLPPSALLLEITESVLLQDDDATMASLHQLRGLGVRLAIDDFGTGYSSLSYLRRLPIDVLKIDKTFVDDVVDSTQAEAVVRTIVSLSEALHLETIAEGVEDTAQLQALRCLGSTRAPGVPLLPAPPGR